MVVATIIGSALVELVVGAGVIAATAPGKESLKKQVEARARQQIASGTAIPIPPERLAAFQQATLPFPLTGQARKFAFIGEGSTLSIAQRIALGILQEAGPDPRFSPSFTLQRGPRSAALSQFVPPLRVATSLSERLRLRNGNLRRTPFHGRRNWRELLAGRAQP